MTSFFFFFSSRRRHTRLQGDWSSDVCSSDLKTPLILALALSALIAVAPALAQQPKTSALINEELDKITEPLQLSGTLPQALRSEERRVGKECRSRCSPDR